jgi:4-hydroxybenzoate polyprenyltransferase
VTVSTALAVAAGCAVLALIGSLLLSNALAAIVLTYILLMVFYSLGLKHVMILDCAIIALGFCLRAVAGAVVIEVYISPWLVICTFALTLFFRNGRDRPVKRIVGGTHPGRVYANRSHADVAAAG